MKRHINATKGTVENKGLFVENICKWNNGRRIYSSLRLHAMHNPRHLLRGDVARYVSTCDAQSPPFATRGRSTRLYMRCTIPASNLENLVNLVKIMLQIASISSKIPQTSLAFTLRRSLFFTISKKNALIIPWYRAEWNHLTLFNLQDNIPLL